MSLKEFFPNSVFKPLLIEYLRNKAEFKSLNAKYKRPFRGFVLKPDSSDGTDLPKDNTPDLRHPFGKPERKESEHEDLLRLSDGYFELGFSLSQECIDSFNKQYPSSMNLKALPGMIICAYKFELKLLTPFGELANLVNTLGSDPALSQPVWYSIQNHVRLIVHDLKILSFDEVNLTGKPSIEEDDQVKSHLDFILHHNFKRQIVELKQAVNPESIHKKGFKLPPKSVLPSVAKKNEAKFCSSGMPKVLQAMNVNKKDIAFELMKAQHKKENEGYSKKRVQFADDLVTKNKYQVEVNQIDTEMITTKIEKSGKIIVCDTKQKAHLDAEEIKEAKKAAKARLTIDPEFAFKTFFYSLTKGSMAKSVGNELSGFLSQSNADDDIMQALDCSQATQIDKVVMAHVLDKPVGITDEDMDLIEGLDDSPAPRCLKKKDSDDDDESVDLLDEGLGDLVLTQSQATQKKPVIEAYSQNRQAMREQADEEVEASSVDEEPIMEAELRKSAESASAKAAEAADHIAEEQPKEDSIQKELEALKTGKELGISDLIDEEASSVDEEDSPGAQKEDIKNPEIEKPEREPSAKQSPKKDLALPALDDLIGNKEDVISNSNSILENEKLQREQEEKMNQGRINLDIPGEEPINLIGMGTNQKKKQQSLIEFRKKEASTIELKEVKEANETQQVNQNSGSSAQLVSSGGTQQGLQGEQKNSKKQEFNSQLDLLDTLQDGDARASPAKDMASRGKNLLAADLELIAESSDSQPLLDSQQVNLDQQTPKKREAKTKAKDGKPAEVKKPSTDKASAPKPSASNQASASKASASKSSASKQPAKKAIGEKRESTAKAEKGVEPAKKKQQTLVSMFAKK